MPSEIFRDRVAASSIGKEGPPDETCYWMGFSHICPDRSVFRLYVQEDRLHSSRLASYPATGSAFGFSTARQGADSASLPAGAIIHFETSSCYYGKRRNDRFGFTRSTAGQEADSRTSAAATADGVNAPGGPG